MRQNSDKVTWRAHVPLKFCLLQWGPHLKLFSMQCKMTTTEYKSEVLYKAWGSLHVEWKSCYPSYCLALINFHHIPLLPLTNKLACSDVLYSTLFQGTFFNIIYTNLNFFSSLKIHVLLSSRGDALLACAFQTIEGFHMTSLKFKLQNYWFSWDLLSWCIRAAENQYSYKFLLQMGFWFCDRLCLNF